MLDPVKNSIKNINCNNIKDNKPATHHNILKLPLSCSMKYLKAKTNNMYLKKPKLRIKLSLLFAIKIEFANKQNHKSIKI